MTNQKLASEWWIRARKQGVVALLVTLAGAGCQTKSNTQRPASLGWEDHRFLNQPQPYDALLVEIDAVEGTQPSARELAELKAFLERATNKPGGVTIKLDNIIPRAVARKHKADALALEYLNGPADPRTAFLYIFCYRSRLAGLFRKPDNPQFTYFPYPCSVFIDRSFVPILRFFYPAEMRRAVLWHETGHALGLGRNASHSEDFHCADPNCLMSPTVVFNWKRFFTFRQPWQNAKLCAECERDLETYKTSAPRKNERMWNGYFVHEKPEYQFLTLPGFLYLHIGDAAGISESEVAEARQKAITKLSADTWVSATTNEFDLPENAPALALLAEEKNEIIRGLVLNVFENCVSAAESWSKSEPEKVREFISDALLAAAKNFPDAQSKLRALRDKTALIVTAGVRAEEPLIEANGR